MDTGGGEAESTQEVIPWRGAQPYLTSGLQGYSNLYAQGGPGYYPGQDYITNDPIKDYAQGLNMAYAQQSLPGQVGDALGAQSSMLNAPDVANNPYVGGMADVIQKRMTRQFTEDMMPRMEMGAMAAGQKGGSREAIIQAQGARNVQEATGDALANLYGGAYGQGLEQQARGMALAPQTAQFGMMPMNVMSGVGDYRQAASDQALQSDMSRWDYLQQQPYSNLDWYMSGVNFAPWGSETTTEQPGSSPVASALGGGLMGYGLMGSPIGAIGGALLGGLF